MTNEEFPYQKINFILSVIGFIGSIGFYYGVLKNMNNENPTKGEVAKLKREIRKLKRELDLAKKQK